MTGQDDRPIKQIEHDLLLGWAATSYLPMLSVDGSIKQRFEIVYRTGNGGLAGWAKARIKKLMERAARLKCDHGDRFIPSPEIDDIVERLKAALQANDEPRPRVVAPEFL